MKNARDNPQVRLSNYSLYLITFITEFYMDWFYFGFRFESQFNIKYKYNAYIIKYATMQIEVFRSFIKSRSCIIIRSTIIIDLHYS